MNGASSGFAMWILAILVLSGSSVAGGPAGSASEAEAAMQRLLERYAAIRTYADRTTIEENITISRGPAGPVTSTSTTPTTLTFDRTGRLAMHAVRGSVLTDGETLWKVSPGGDRYTVDEAPASLDAIEFAFGDDLVSANQFIVEHPVIGLLLGDAEMEGTGLDGFADAGALRRETKEGRVCEVITASVLTRRMSAFDPFAGAERPRSPVELWVDVETGLLRSVTIDLTETIRSMFEQMLTVPGFPAGLVPMIESAKAQYSIDILHVDDDLPDSIFSFDTTGREEVDSLDSPFDMEIDDLDGGGYGDVEGVQYIHNPVPAFEAVTMSGEDVSTESLEGKVVLLDFWATWCPPCVAAIPEIQKLAEEFADVGLVVIGINQEGEGLNVKVRKFLEQKNITFPQVLDPHDTIGRLFAVTALPTTVLIDRAGIVQAYHVGFSGADVYREEVRRVLAGEQLEKPQVPPSPLPEDVNPDIISVGRSREALVTAWQGRHLPMAEGEVLVAPSDEGGLMKLNAEKGVFESIPLQGIDGERSVLAFTPIVIAGMAEPQGWVLATDHAYDYGDLEIERYDAAGEQKWFVGLGVDAASEPMYEAAVEFADINGDGVSDIVLFANVISSSSGQENQVLMIMNDDGGILTRREISLDGFGGIEIVPQGPGRPSKIVLIGISEMVTVEWGL